MILPVQAELEYPAGKVLLDGSNWLSDPKISPDGKWVAFSDHQNAEGDDRGTVAVIGPDGKEKILSSGWSSIEGVLWSPAGDEIWFTASLKGSSDNLYMASRSKESSATSRTCPAACGCKTCAMERRWW